MTIDSIKLIIWDLDDTLWSGTISEGSITLSPDHKQLIKELVDIGVVNSICSKNDYDVVCSELKKQGIWEYFVFPSINWEAKGKRIQKIIESMNLRAPNVLFIDDNNQNLEEAKFYCPGIMTMLPDQIDGLIADVHIAEKKDIEHKRLRQYRQLEKKEEERGKSSSNDEFLNSCNIQVEIRNDCMTNVKRIHELIQRSNQLNYTKFRQTESELIDLIEDPNNQCGYVNVCDKYGDYGLVGFFAVAQGKLIHFAFSCRTLGMRIEQYVYYWLGCPIVEISGEVVAPLNQYENPAWINKEAYVKDTSVKLKKEAKGKILLKGPCDMSQMYAFLEETDNLVTEFSYTNEKGVFVEGHNHTAQIITALFADEDIKNALVAGMDFFDDAMLETSMRTEHYDFIVLSMLTDGNLGIYRHKKTGEYVALCEKVNDLTAPKNWERFIKKELYTSNIDFSEKTLSSFSKEYEFVDNNDGGLTMRCLQRIREYLPSSTKLVLLLGSERQHNRNKNIAYVNRHEEHRQINSKIRKWAQSQENVLLIPFDKFIHSNEDFLDTINHYGKRVYYDLACELVDIFNSSNQNSIRVKCKHTIAYQSVLQKMRNIKYFIVKVIKKWFC